MRLTKFAGVIALAAVTAAQLITTPVAATHARSGDAGLAQVRAATAHYRDVTEAEEHGYALFTDAAHIACIANPPLGAMGIHYVNGDLVASGQIDARKPQALVYEPEEHGQLRLVAVEYVVIQQTWDATHSSPPMLFGQEFMLTTSPNRYGLPAFYSLHAWIWKHNPSGMFNMWNPRVQCDTDTDS
jgi:hypothetical protein